MKKILGLSMVLVLCLVMAGAGNAALRMVAPQSLGTPSAYVPSGAAKVRVACQRNDQWGLEADIYVYELDSNGEIIESSMQHKSPANGSDVFDVMIGKSYKIYGLYIEEVLDMPIGDRYYANYDLNNVTEKDNWVQLILENYGHGNIDINL